MDTKVNKLVEAIKKEQELDNLFFKEIYKEMEKINEKLDKCSSDIKEITCRVQVLRDNIPVNK